MANTRGPPNGIPLEKDYSRDGRLVQDAQAGPGLKVPEHLGVDMPSDTALHRIKTAGSISISPELFEKIYLTPHAPVKGDLRKTFGNPTPLALLGFLLCLTPLGCDLMEWRGAGGSGAASIGAYYFMGGVLMIIGGLLEFFLGNTFPFVVFGSFGGFWLAFGATLQPYYYAYGLYSPDPTNEAAGLTDPHFQASFGFFMLFMGLLVFVYFICSLRTNICFVIIFAGLTFAFGFLTGSYWQGALGNAKLALRLQKGAGGSCFVTSMAGWYIFFAQMLVALDFPYQIPIGNLSQVVPSHTERIRAKARGDYDV